MTDPSLTAIPTMEATLRQIGVTMEAFYERASIDRATWHRWRSGAFEPRMRTWRRARHAYEEIIAESADAARAAKMQQQHGENSR